MAALAEILPFQKQASLPTSPRPPGRGLEVMHEFASILRALPAGFKLERAYYWSRPTSTVHRTGHVVEEDRQPFRDMALCGQRQGVPVRLRLTGRIARLLHTIVAMSATPFSLLS